VVVASEPQPEAKAERDIDDNRRARGGAAPSAGGWLCTLVLFLEGYDIAAARYAVRVDVWRVPLPASPKR
jgi:hypothetical protein